MTNQTLDTLCNNETKSKGEICIHYVRTKLHPIVSEENLHHLNCGGYNTQCENYRASRNYYVLLNQGRTALIFQ